MILLALTIILFLFLSGVMAAVDAAVLSVTFPEIDGLIQDRRWGSRRLSRVKHELSKSVVAIVILTNSINVLGPILVSMQAYQLFGSKGVMAVTALLAFGTIVFSEIVPKSLGSHYAPQIARLSAPAILASQILLYPFVAAFSWLSDHLARGTRRIGTEQQIRSLVRIGKQQGHIETDEGQMIQRVFILNDKTAGEIMTPLKHVKALGGSYTAEQAAGEVCRTEFSRYPVFGDSPNDVLGVALTREVLKAAKDSPHQPMSALARHGTIVNAQIKSDELIALFRQRHIQLAIVQDEGRTVGVVTLDDVLNQLIGDV